MTPNWSIENGTYGPRMVVTGPWSPKAEALIENRGIKELELNYAKGWSGHDYSFLDHLAGLDALDITDWNATDITAIHSLHGLRRLDVSTYCKTEIRFSQFPHLEECSLEWRPKARSLFEHAGIKKLFINKCPGKDLTSFEKMTGLRSLSLASPKIETLEGIAALNKLTFLGIYVARRLTGLDGLQALTDLVQLEVTDSRRIKDISPLANLHKLEELHLNNDGEIETLKPIAGLKHLRVVLFYESTNILDGDLSVLKGLPKLENVALMERRHYSHKRRDLPQRRAPSA